MREVSPSAAQDFERCDPTKFCRAYILPSCKSDVVVSNMVETFNGYILQARSNHIIDMLEDIRTALMERLVVKKLEMEKVNDDICPRLRTKLEKNKVKARKCYSQASNLNMFQVTDHLNKFVVDLNMRTCTCKQWDLTGLPCAHVISAVTWLKHDCEEYVDAYLRKDTYLKAYDVSINPCVSERSGLKKELLLQPPLIKIGPGRPRKCRRKHPHEDPKKPGKLTKHGIQMTCSICKSKAHNKRKCPLKDQQVEAPSKRGRGRPRKDGSSTTTTASVAEIVAAPDSGRGGKGKGKG
ncbi:uncharacterized protein LOC110739410 [Chenopodium quinoa]|uniref:uncharacterized protein LOC110739410 n=1 Tax=Chenopodium quinoa TaxID=63459 RepID=UPI000B77200B|nr:uncharacterized protein LOC110739410 [Chenopodium quinoa]